MEILVIEDDPVDRKLVGIVLATSGHIVRERVSGEEAIEAIATARPDLVLIDLRLPGMNGLDLARKLKSIPENRDLPLIAVTAVPELFSREAALAAGCDAFLVKPIDTRTLAQQVTEIVEKKAAAE
jgi:two-component system cell cycle response regulator